MTADALRHPRIASIALGATALLVAALATADEAADRKAEAQRLFVEGQAALDKGDNATGCNLMRVSLGLFAVANSLFNVAQCDERDGKLVSALEHWKRGLSLIDATDKRTPVVKKAIEDLEVRVPRMRIVMDSKHAPLEVLVNNEVVPTDKLSAALYVDPGKHIVKMRKTGHEDRYIEIVLNERERTEVVAEPGAAIAKPLPTASTGASTAIPPPPPPGMPPMKIGGFVALGVGGAALLGAVITGGVISSRHADIDAKCPNKVCNADGRSLIDSQQTLLPLNAALWGVGIAGAATGTLLLVLPALKKKDTPAATVTPIVTNQSAGIGLSGRF